MERPGFESLADHQGVRYTYAAAYEGANAWYLRMILGSRVQFVEDSVMRVLSRFARSAGHAVFPQRRFLPNDRRHALYPAQLIFRI